jgi:hypothetical protein
MGFLLRTAFWFSLVLLVIPFDMAGEDGPQRVGPVDTFIAAREAVSDLSGLCERKPEVCEIGKTAMNTVGLRAREAARIAYQMLDANFGGTSAADQETVTGGIERLMESAEIGKNAEHAAPVPATKPDQ